MPESGDIKQLQQDLSNFIKTIQEQIHSVNNLADLDNLRVSALGKKGKLTQKLQQLGKLPNELRPVFGQEINQAKVKLNDFFSKKLDQLKQAELNHKLSSERIDISLPGRSENLGSRHPLRLVTREFTDFFTQRGFSLAVGPDIETDYYNFQALNVPEHHPARASQDTFYFDAHTILRTQTSSVQIRVMEETGAPIRIISPGSVYRSDAEDATHTPMFHQLEGLWLDTNTSFADLKGLLLDFLHDFFGPEVSVRFRPSYFPFTEPSAEVDIGYDVNGTTKWLEVLGCGMVHPNVLKSVGIDADKYRGFAFGMGIERFAMLKYRMQDIRLFYENDQRFLRQFIKI